MMLIHLLSPGVIVAMAKSTMGKEKDIIYVVEKLVMLKHLNNPSLINKKKELMVTQA